MVAPFLIPSLRLIRRTLEIETAYTLSRLQVLERMPGNPVGVAYRRIDEGAIALMARHLPVPSFNSVIGLRAGHEGHIEPLVAWYRAAEVSARFEAVPGYYDPALGRELTRLGYFQSDFHVSVVCEPSLEEPAPAAGVSVEQVTAAPALEEFLDAYIAGRQIPRGEQFKANVRPWLEQSGWQVRRCSTSASVPPTAPMRPPIRPTAGGACRRPCFAVA
jgi:hypothetical protein